MWTGYVDNFTCGRLKMEFEFILVESDLDTSIEYLEQAKLYNPYGASCFCCGDDYKINTSNIQHEALQISLEDFQVLIEQKKVLIVPFEQVKMKLSLSS